MVKGEVFLNDLNSKSLLKDVIPLYRPVEGVSQDFFCGKNQNFYALEEGLDGQKVIRKKPIPLGCQLLLWSIYRLALKNHKLKT